MMSGKLRTCSRPVCVTSPDARPSFLQRSFSPADPPLRLLLSCVGKSCQGQRQALKMLLCRLPASDVSRAVGTLALPGANTLCQQRRGDRWRRRGVSSTGIQLSSKHASVGTVAQKGPAQGFFLLKAPVQGDEPDWKRRLNLVRICEACLLVLTATPAGEGWNS